MSNYCSNCRFTPNEKLGNSACPFTTLYWDFLSRNRNKLKGNARMRMQYMNLDRIEPSDRRKIRKKAAEIKKQMTQKSYL